MAEHGDGGGAQSGAGFFLALFAAVAVAWFFAQMQKQERTTVEDTPVVTETDAVFEAEETPELRTSARSSPAPALSQKEHGVTYYLDEDGNILDVVHF